MKLIITIKGYKYDLTEFQDIHPGGGLVFNLLKDGDDATNLFESYHSMNIINSGLLNKYIVQKDTNSYYQSMSGFYVELKEKTEEYIRKIKLTKKKNSKFQIQRIIFLWGGLISSYFSIYVFECNIYKYICCLMYAFFSIQIGFHLVHDASHMVMFKSPKLNHIVGFVSYDILLGLSYINWVKNHIIGHHIHCNMNELDPDLNASPIRLCNSQKYEWYHRYQNIYAYILYCFLHTAIFINDLMSFNTNMLYKYKCFNCIGKIIHVLLFMILPVYIYDNVSMLDIFYYYTLSHLVGSFFISLVFQISHISKKNKFDLIEDFATNQIETTHDYSVRSKWVTLLTGGLNFQVIHHLLPNVSQIYYLDLYDMVNDICKKHGKLYTKSSTIFGALQSHFKQIKQMSEDKYFEDDEYYIINKKMN